VKAERSGWVVELDAEAIGRATCLLGSGRNRVEDQVDHAVGAIVHANRGAAVKTGDVLVEVQFRGDEQLAAALPMIRDAYRIGDAAPPERPLVYETID
jgi:pyrimidine-nucleoside phosphorylase